MTDKNFLNLVEERLSPAGEVKLRPMMGDWLLYLDGRLIGLVCDDALFFKKNAANAQFMTGVAEGVPYDGAKPAYMPDIDDEEFLTTAARLTRDGAKPPKKALG